MTDSTADAATLAVVVARLDDLRAQVSGLSTQLENQQRIYLPRTEWDLWRANANRELEDMHGDIDRRHVSWPSVAAAVCAIAALGLSILTRVSP